MIFSTALFDAWDGLLEYAIADLSHLLQDGFEFSVIGNRCFVEGDLLLGESDADSLCFEFARQTPSPGWLWQYTTLSDPSQFKQLFFQVPVALLDPAEGSGS